MSSRPTPTPPLSLDRSSGEPLYRQIEDQLRQAIVERRLRPGSRVPSIRGLARDLGVARLTVVTAYEQLAAEGYLVGRVGAGTVVAAQANLDSQGVDLDHPAKWPAHSGSMPIVRDAIPNEPLRAERVGVQATAMFDFRPEAVALDLFPSRAWERLTREAWSEMAGTATRADVDYPDPAGDPVLRAALASHLAESRATRGRSARLVITSGTPAALAAIAALWLEPGRIAVVEEPCHPGIRRTLEVSGATVVTVPVDDRGLIPDELPPSASLAVVTPAWEFPLGGTLPLARRTRVLAWAARVGAMVVEDDRESEPRYSGPPLASLQGLDPEGRVIHLGSFSRVLFPGLRTGCAIVPDRFVDRFTAVLQTLDRGPSALEQRALARFIARGYLNRYLRRLATVLGERQAALLEALGRELGRLLSVEPAPIGLHLVAQVEHDRWTVARIVDLARSAGVLLEAIHTHAPALGDGDAGGRRREGRLLIQYARHDPSSIRAGIACLARALEAGGPGVPSESPRDSESVLRPGSAVAPVAAARSGRRVAQP